MFQDLERHEMVLKIVYPAGAEEWACPTCGRRFVIQWTPEFKRVVLEEGEEYTTHIVGDAGIQLQSAHSDEADGDELAASKLAPWVEGLAEIDFGNF
jgi:hypothetical protein